MNVLDTATKNQQSRNDANELAARRAADVNKARAAEIAQAKQTGFFEGLANLFAPRGKVFEPMVDKAEINKYLADRGYHKVEDNPVPVKQPTKSALLEGLPATVDKNGIPTYIQDSGGF